jgi:hypothetical protein
VVYISVDLPDWRCWTKQRGNVPGRSVCKLVRPDGLFALRAHPFGAALWAFSADAALCSRLRRSSSASLRTAAAKRRRPTRRGAGLSNRLVVRQGFDLLVSDLVPRDAEELFDKKCARRDSNP